MKQIQLHITCFLFLRLDFTGIVNISFYMEALSRTQKKNQNIYTKIKHWLLKFLLVIMV